MPNDLRHRLNEQMSRLEFMARGQFGDANNLFSAADGEGKTCGSR